jgi:hypothetical protein
VTGADGKPPDLGRGAMRVTYKAFDVDLHCPVTLKVINERYLGDEAARLRFLREEKGSAVAGSCRYWRFDLLRMVCPTVKDLVH